MLNNFDHILPQVRYIGPFVVDYLLKPFDIPEMLSVIGQALEAGHLMRSTIDINALPEKATSASRGFCWQVCYQRYISRT